MAIDTFKAAFAAIAIACSGSAFAQSTSEDPLSAIGWLSDVVQDPPEPGPAVATTDNATPQEITTTQLGQAKIDAVGLLAPSVSGLPKNFWGPSSVSDLVALITRQRPDPAPPMAALLQRILLAELTPPFDSDDRAALFLARVDKLLEIGALDPAQALLEQAGPRNAAIFQRLFDVSLLAGREDRVCKAMLDQPEFAPTYPARIFCLARDGDWDAAALTLGTAELLGLVSKNEDALLARFLDPDLFEGAPHLPYPDRITPLNFRMHAAIGEPLSLGTVPDAFAYAALDTSYGWKTRLNAAERLARSGAIVPPVLIDLYLEREAAASGGVWDRVDAIQALDAAIEAKDEPALILALPLAIRTMRRAGLIDVLAQYYGPKLTENRHESLVALDAARLILLSPAYELAPANGLLPESAPLIWSAVATGQIGKLRSDDPLEAAILDGFRTPELPTQYQQLLDDNRFGEASLQAIALLGDTEVLDPSSVQTGLALLRALRLEDSARRMALHLLIRRSF